MSKNMITIIKKEFARFFGDKRLVFTTVLMPGLMIYVMYSFMGKAMMSQFTTEQDYVYEIHTVHLPESLQELKSDDQWNILEEEPKDVEEVKDEIVQQEADLLVVFPEDFDAVVAAYDAAAEEAPAPEIQIYFNSVSTESTSAYDIIYDRFEQYESSLANKFDINASVGEDYNLATEKDTTGQIFSMMLPMLMMVFLFSGCIAIAPESIAGEKERGTIATLLVTPMKRSELAFGKIISLSVLGLLSGVSSFFGTMLALPKMMGGPSEDGGSGMNAGVYSGTDYLLVLLVILSTVLVIIAAISIISGFSKSVKEAGTAVSPLMIIVMVIGITSMLGGGAPKEMFWYLIPLYNSVQCMNGIFSFSIIPVNFVVTVLSNLVYTVLMAGILAKLFDSEKIMYQ